MYAATNITVAHQPTVSILMPVYNVDVRWLRQAIESVRAQIYPHWQLCIADDASFDVALRHLLTEYQAKDERIHVIFREQNGHISECSNSALQLATGEWLALLDHDDVLPAHALFEVVKVLNRQPATQLIYSDEDIIDEHHRRFNPHFKSDLNLDLLYGQNYVSHLGVYCTEIAKEIGGFRTGVEGSQDYDFLLRYLLKIQYQNIVHIPKILYHWRAIEGSAALSSKAKSYTTDAGIKALQDYFVQLNENVMVTRGKSDNLYRVQWLMCRQPLVSLIVSMYGADAQSERAIDSILQKTAYPNYEMILVYSHLNDVQQGHVLEKWQQNPKVRVLHYPYPFHYAAVNNFATKDAKGEIIGLLHHHIEVINEDWLAEMVSHAMRPDIGCVGAMLYYPNDTVHHAGLIICDTQVLHSHQFIPKKNQGYFARLSSVQNVSAVTAACLLVRKEIFDEVQGLNESDLTVAFYDVDLCLKVQAANYRNLWTPFAELYYYESIHHQTAKQQSVDWDSDWAYMVQKWHINQYHDPYYNPNLYDGHAHFAIAMQTRIQD